MLSFYSKRYQIAVHIEFHLMILYHVIQSLIENIPWLWSPCVVKMRSAIWYTYVLWCVHCCFPWSRITPFHLSIFYRITLLVWNDCPEPANIFFHCNLSWGITIHTNTETTGQNKLSFAIINFVGWEWLYTFGGCECIVELYHKKSKKHRDNHLYFSHHFVFRWPDISFIELSHL